MLKTLPVDLQSIDSSMLGADSGPLEVRYDILESSGFMFRAHAQLEPWRCELISQARKWLARPLGADHRESRVCDLEIEVDDRAFARVEHGHITTDGGVL